MDFCVSEEAEKPHAVCIPFPAQGHINPMLRVAKLLHRKGFHITFIHTEFSYTRLLNSRALTSRNASSTFQIKLIPDGLPHNSDRDFPALCHSLAKNGLIPFRDLISNLNIPITCIVSDPLMGFVNDAAKEFSIPNILLWVTNASSMACFLHFRALNERGVLPLKEDSYLTNGYLETPINCIPGVKNVRLKDLPSLIRTTDPDDFLLKFSMEQLDRRNDASAIIINTFDALEIETLETLKKPLLLPPLYCMGPLHLLHPESSTELDRIKPNLWKQDTQCLKWLDYKDPNSVVYINFGSTTVMTTHQLNEFAWGLSYSKYSFLWIIRPGLVVGDSASLPVEFITETKQRGLITGWCPQEQVLNHHAIGGFLCHNGWNSVLESMCSGVPVLCWPFFGDHPTVFRYSCLHWGVGMEIDNDVKRDEVEKLVRELMEGEKGREMKLKAMAWKKKAEEASACGGSSDINFNKLLDHVLKGGKLSRPN